jgi:hypothetical protein
MPRRALLAPSFLLALGFLLSGGMVISRFAVLFDPAPRADLAHLISLALGDSDPELPHGDSLLESGGVTLATTESAASPESPSVTRELYPAPPGTAGETGAEAQPAAWAREAAARNPDALREWLGWGVLSVATTEGDTIRLRMYRLHLHQGCPLVDRVEAVLIRPTGGWDTRLARVDGGCWA